MWCLVCVDTQLEELFQQRIAYIDGAMGTCIQAYKLQEEDYRGDHFKDAPGELKGNNDLLVITRPDVSVGGLADPALARGQTTVPLPTRFRSR
jgi:5-methyltetrahydrofolate--homocysteine methyltransferase